MRFREHWLTYTVLLLSAFGVISWMVWWGSQQVDKFPDDWSYMPPRTEITETTTVPTPTPNCPEGMKWSKHAQKCYIPPVEGGNKINAIPKPTATPTTKNGS